MSSSPKKKIQKTARGNSHRRDQRLSIDGARHPDILQKKAQARTALQDLQYGKISPRTAMARATSESEKESILLVDHCRKEPTELTLTTTNRELHSMVT